MFSKLLSDKTQTALRDELVDAAGNIISHEGYALSKKMAQTLIALFDEGNSAPWHPLIASIIDAMVIKVVVTESGKMFEVFAEDTKGMMIFVATIAVLMSEVSKIATTPQQKSYLEALYQFILETCKDLLEGKGDNPASYSQVIKRRMADFNGGTKDYSCLVQDVGTIALSGMILADIKTNIKLVDDKAKELQSIMSARIDFFIETMQIAVQASHLEAFDAKECAALKAKVEALKAKLSTYGGDGAIFKHNPAAARGLLSGFALGKSVLTEPGKENYKAFCDYYRTELDLIAKAIDGTLSVDESSRFAAFVQTAESNLHGILNIFPAIFLHKAILSFFHLDISVFVKVQNPLLNSLRLKFDRLTDVFTDEMKAISQRLWLGEVEGATADFLELWRCVEREPTAFKRAIFDKHTFKNVMNVLANAVKAHPNYGQIVNIAKEARAYYIETKQPRTAADMAKDFGLGEHVAPAAAGAGSVACVVLGTPDTKTGASSTSGFACVAPGTPVAGAGVLASPHS